MHRILALALCALGALSRGPTAYAALRLHQVQEGQEGKRVAGGLETKVSFEKEAAAEPEVAPLPVVLWHGMGDSCCNPWSLGWVAKHLEDKYGITVVSINSGGGSEAGDVLSGFYGNVSDQVEAACMKLRDDDRLADGFNAIGFSQGGQFLRAVVERCGHTGVNMKSLVTMGAQHAGVVNAPGCVRATWGLPETGLCWLLQRFFAWGAYLPIIRDRIVQAQYFRDPEKPEHYLASNPFLPDINNEKADKNELYTDNLKSLDMLVLVRFRDDITAVPRDSAWFTYHNGTALVPLADQPQYWEDWLGLRTLDESGRLQFEEAPGAHMQIDIDWFDAHIIEAYLV